jgi:ubiquinone/menaquinone biosynthesis C-methylase UbiE
MHADGYQRWRSRIREEGFETLEGVRLLDIGCGDRAPFSLLSASEGASVVGIDLLPIELGWQRPVMWVRLTRDGRWREVTRQVLRDSLHTWRYHGALARAFGRPLPTRKIKLHVMDAECLEFPDNSFDLIVSAAVWEHVRDVRSATREVNRVLAPGGLAYIQVAMFPALQGGHHAEWHDLSPGSIRTIRPWDHIRKHPRPLPLFCNGWAESQYREVFDTETEMVEWAPGSLRGGEYLTPELRSELSNYSNRDLLLPFIDVWTRKRAAVVKQPLWENA